MDNEDICIDPLICISFYCSDSHVTYNSIVSDIIGSSSYAGVWKFLSFVQQQNRTFALLKSFLIIFISVFVLSFSGWAPPALE